jgi:hypothetical protein
MPGGSAARGEKATRFRWPSGNANGGPDAEEDARGPCGKSLPELLKNRP